MQPRDPTRKRRYLVTRHPGALRWLERQGIVAEHVTHLDPATLLPGDEVIGNLPIHIVAAACRRGARYLHLAVDVPAQLRGRELGDALLDQLGARLLAYHCQEVVQQGPGRRPQIT